MSFFHSKGFCIYSSPHSDELSLCLNNRLGNQQGLDFIIAPFHKEQAKIRFMQPEIRQITFEDLLKNRKELAELDHPAELNLKQVSKTEFISSITQAQKSFDKESFTKVIAARNRIIDRPENFQILAFFDRLRKQQESNFAYLFYSPRTGFWLGTTPELLLEQKQNHLKTMSLAGTRKAENPNWTNKELEEQAIVTHFIQMELESLGAKDLKVESRRNVQSAHIQHLCNDISAKMRNSTPPYKIIKSLHPTPAVSGYGKTQAIEFINKTETFDRSFYSGYIGLMNNSEAQLYVNLRCMRIGKQHIELFAGAGITAESDPEKEFEETETKLQTLLKHFSEA